MASGDTNITICNQALNLLGADTISSFTDTTNDAATVCNNIYETVKKQTLSMYPWSFALTKQQLSRSSTTPVNEWAYQYDLPSTAISGTPLQFYKSSYTRILTVQNFEIL